jgi:hypothetical protein
MLGDFSSDAEATDESNSGSNSELVLDALLTKMSPSSSIRGDERCADWVGFGRAMGVS